MPRKTRVEAAPPAAPPAPAIIHPTGVYQVATVRAMLGLRQSSLRRELREKRLRVCKRCGRYYFLGEQLLTWLRGGEVCPD